MLAKQTLSLNPPIFQHNPFFPLSANISDKQMTSKMTSTFSRTRLAQYRQTRVKTAAKCTPFELYLKSNLTSTLTSDEYVKKNVRQGNRHLANSFTQFKDFLNKDFIAPIEITENLCKQFRKFLLDKYNGLTPLNYFAWFKEVVSAAKVDGYFHTNPIENVDAKSNPSTSLKEMLEVEDYIALLNTPYFSEEIRGAFIFSCYTGLRCVM